MNIWLIQLLKGEMSLKEFMDLQITQAIIIMIGSMIMIVGLILIILEIV